MANVWTITVDERRKHDDQFVALNPVNGFITGDQARGFFLKSNIPPPVLAQIWDLADMNKDGKMDRREFSIAMHLIKKKLQGATLPTVLPESLKAEPAMTPTVMSSSNYGTVAAQMASFPGPQIRQPWMPSGMPPLMGQPLAMAPVMHPSVVQPAYFGGSGNPPVATPVQPVTTQPPNAYVDWTMPQSNRLKYSQHFNSLDKEKTGFLSGAQARSHFGHSDLPSSTLAMIWYLSDLDKDGRLTVDEFAIASHLIDKVKHGATLPKTLPPELAPTNWQRGFRHQRTASFGSEDIVVSPRSSSSFSYESGDIIKAPKMVATFEDKRRQNMERGQAEIERRRMLLQEQEKREREERERKQREERERQEREREEQDRKRQQEFERQQAKFREEQEKREQEYKRMLEQREAARREAERQRQLELETQRLQELRNQRQREQEAVCHSKQRRMNLSFQVQELTKKAHDLNTRITEMRDKVGNATASFEMMKAVRDRTLLEIENGSRKVQELRTKSMQYENEKLSLLARKRAGVPVANSSITDSYRQTVTACKSSEVNLENLRRSLAEVDESIRQKQMAVQGKETSSRNSVDQARKQAAEYKELVRRVNDIMARVKSARGSIALPANGTTTWNSSNGYTSYDTATPSANTVHYQVVYDFDAANEGELTLRVGDIVLVFIDHPVEEGWLAGQIGDRVGWFPKDFAVPLDQAAACAAPVQAQVTAPDTSSVAETIRRFEQSKQQTAHVHLPKSTSPKKTAAVKEVGEWYVAAFPFSAAEEGDLGFEVGERIFVIQKGDDWWTGRIGDREGIFPATYVQEIFEASEQPRVEETTVAVPKKDTPPPAATVVAKVTEAPAVVVTEKEEDNDLSAQSDEVCEVAQAIAQYQAADENQLSLEIGDLIKIRSKSPAGWWEGEVQRKGEPSQIGWFPGSYVEILDGGRAADTSPHPASEQRIESTSDGGSEENEVVEALFDYAKQQDDELSFTRGSMIVVLEKLDGDWWRGRLADGQVGLIPANYVKSGSSTGGARNGDANAEESRHSSVASTPTSELRKRSMYCQELEQTEQNYADDLQMVVDVFYKQLEVSGLLAPKEVGTLFINWLELLSTANAFVADLRSSSEQHIGVTILKNIENLKRVFVTFCRHQQAALDFLEAKEKASARFRALHAQCSQHPAAKGLQLSYYLLIPLARVTKYHLTVKEILKYTPTVHGDYENLQKAHTALRQLCDEVNEVATETENLQMLYWCQNHVKCDSIQPKLVFHSPTNSLGPRRFIHSGILYKAASGRLLVGLLFNDFLMLTTPDERINHPDAFKLSRTSEIPLALYKTPILLAKATLQPAPASSGPAADGSTNPAECVIVLSYGEDVISLRTVSSNAKILWTKQLDKAIKVARETGSLRSRISTVSSAAIGRLLLEVVFVRNLVVPQDCKGASFYIEFAFGRQKHTKSIDLSRTDTLCTTQMVLDSKTGVVQLAIFAERVYSPDISVGRTEMELGSMLKMAGSQRNPAVKQLALTSDFTAQSDAVSGHLIVKFVVQLFDDQ